MRQVKYVIKAGNTIEIEKIRMERSYHQGSERQAKSQPTSERQKKVNERLAEKKLRRLMNANFDNSCLYLTLMYIKEQDQPYVTAEDMDADMSRLLRKLRAWYKREGKAAGKKIELKYVWVKAVGERSARHFHMVLSGLPHLSFRDIQRKLQELWDEIYLRRHSRRSFINLRYLRGDHYGHLAAYFIKQSKTTFGTLGKKVGKKWCASRNLVRPVPERVVIYGKRSFDSEPRPRAGWYMDPDYTVKVEPEDSECGFSYRAWLLVRPKKGSGNALRD